MFRKLYTTVCLLGVFALLVSGCRGEQTLSTQTATASPFAANGDYWPTKGWRTALPQTQGLNPDKLQQMYTAIEEQNLALHSVVIVRNGYIIAETYYPPYEQDTRHELYSCTKSFVSALVGIAIEEGYLEGVDEPTTACFPTHDFANTGHAQIRDDHRALADDDLRAGLAGGRPHLPAIVEPAGIGCSSCSTGQWWPSRVANSTTTLAARTCCRPSSPGAAVS